MRMDVDEKFTKRHVDSEKTRRCLVVARRDAHGRLVAVYKCAMDPTDHEDIVWLHTQVRLSPPAFRAYESSSFVLLVPLSSALGPRERPV